MKLFAVIMMLGLSASCTIAQESWMIVLHKKVLLTGKEESEEKNVKMIRSTDWRKNGYLEVTYKEPQPCTHFHSIRFSDESGNELLVKDSVTRTKISTATLRKLFTGKKQVKIHLTIAPSDPMSMMPARRIHLATLKLP